MNREYNGKVSSKNSKLLLKNLQNTVGDYFFLPHPVGIHYFHQLYILCEQLSPLLLLESTYKYCTVSSTMIQSGYYLVPRLCSPAPTGLSVEAFPLPQLPREFLNLGSQSSGFPAGFYRSRSRAKHYSEAFSQC